MQLYPFQYKLMRYLMFSWLHEYCIVNNTYSIYVNLKLVIESKLEQNV